MRAIAPYLARMEERLIRTPHVAGTKLIAGLFFIALGVLMAADNLDLIDAATVLRYWPAVILLIGLETLMDRGRRLAGAIMTLLGASLLAYNAGWIHFSIFDLWPLLLIGAGIAMVSRSLGVRAAAAAPATTSERGTIIAILNTAKVANTSRDFTGARVFAFMGGCVLDLTDASIVTGPAIVEVFAMWGGIEIYVPDDWEVTGEVIPVMAGFEVKTSPVAAPQKKLMVRGAALMAGIEVKRRKS
jgi:predicted membrane protein